MSRESREIGEVELAERCRKSRHQPYQRESGATGQAALGTLPDKDFRSYWNAMNELGRQHLAATLA